MKKIIALLLCVVMILSLTTACKKEQKTKEKTVITIGLPTNELVTDYENNKLTQWLEKQTGYDLQMIPIAKETDIKAYMEDMAEQGKTLPDILFGFSMNAESVAACGEKGYLQDLTGYFADKGGASKTFWSRVEENCGETEQENIKHKLTYPDSGKIYYVPTIETTLAENIIHKAYINKTWLDALNLPMPREPESLYETLVAFKKGDPNGNGKADEIPLFGFDPFVGEDVVEWIINLYVYYDGAQPLNVDDDGNLFASFTTDQYREALKFLNKLYQEKLINQTCFSTPSASPADLITPTNGTALVGVFCGNLATCTYENNPVLEEYVSLPLYRNVVIRDSAYDWNTFITKDCKNVDAAFDLIMTMWTEEASYRFRYGEEGVNWKKAEAGMISEYGIQAQIIVMDDPLGEKNSCLWSSPCGGLTAYANGEAAIFDGETTPWMSMRGAMTYTVYRNAMDAAETYNPKNICPLLAYIQEEREWVDVVTHYCKDRVESYRADFVKGKKDPNSDADWNDYLEEMKALDLQNWLAVAQEAYERKPNI